jgi:hypothetical protein
VFKNAALLSDNRKARGAVRIAGIDKGSIKTQLKGHLPVIGSVWYNPKVLVNVWSFSKARKMHKVAYAAERDEFTVRVDKGPRGVRYAHLVTASEFDTLT